MTAPNGLEWAATQARPVIHDNDVERLKQLLAEYPALLSWKSDDSDGGLLGIATDSFGDSFDPFREQHFTRGFALEYGHAHLVPLLTRIWPLPDDLPHAAGTGDVAAVMRWFDAAGQPALGDLNRHHPANAPQGRANLQWDAPTVQHVLDVALAWACMNRQFEIASFLLDHGADINTNWSTHEPAGMLHECAVQGNYEAARFLIDRAIDMTRLDYRWNATAEGWARHAANDEPMADFWLRPSGNRAESEYTLYYATLAQEARL